MFVFSFLLAPLALAAQPAQLQPRLQLPQKAILEAQLGVDPRSKLQPGTMVRITATVRNVGTAPSAQGTLQIRLEPSRDFSQSHNALFMTEEQPLPVIAPGQQVQISFSTAHKLPDLNAYAELSMHRAYKAVAKIGTAEKLIGEQRIRISGAYDLPDRMAKPLAEEVPAAAPPAPAVGIAPSQPQPKIRPGSLEMRGLNPQPEPPSRPAR
jgi:hypothetical protein